MCFYQIPNFKNTKNATYTKNPNKKIEKNKQKASETKKKTKSNQTNTFLE